VPWQAVLRLAHAAFFVGEIHELARHVAPLQRGKGAQPLLDRNAKVVCAMDDETWQAPAGGMCRRLVLMGRVRGSVELVPWPRCDGN